MLQVSSAYRPAFSAVAPTLQNIRYLLPTKLVRAIFVNVLEVPKDLVMSRGFEVSGNMQPFKVVPYCG